MQEYKMMIFDKIGLFLIVLLTLLMSLFAKYIFNKIEILANMNSTFISNNVYQIEYLSTDFLVINLFCFVLINTIFLIRCIKREKQF